MLTFSGCRLEPATFRRWQEHFAPPAQPFFVSERLAQKIPAWPRFTREEFGRSGVSLSLHDTFTTYNVAREAGWVVWLTFEAFSSLSHPVQADLLSEQRGFGRGGVFRAGEVAGLEPSPRSALDPGDLFVWWPET